MTHGGGSDDKIVIVVKKRGRKGGHHGGSWKVAYADFVTAMMAFFLVMWIVGMESDVKDLVQGYFNNPVGFRRGFAGGANPMSIGSSPLDGPLDRMPRFVRQVEERRFEGARDRILEGVGGLSDEDMPVVWVDVVEQGLRIDLREREGEPTSFAFGSDAVQPGMARALEIVAGSLSELPNAVVVEGHTDARAYGSEDYTNWELSVDRANAARRVLVRAGLPGDRILEVRGYADRHPLDPRDPAAAANRRVTVLVPFTTQPDDESSPGEAAPSEGAVGEG